MEAIHHAETGQQISRGNRGTWESRAAGTWKKTVDRMGANGFARVVNITSGAIKAPIDILGLTCQNILLDGAVLTLGRFNPWSGQLPVHH